MSPGNSEWQISAQTYDRLGESVLWHPVEEALYWIDFYGPFVHRQKKGKGAVERWKIPVGEMIGSLVFAEKGLLLALDHGLHLFDPETGLTRFFADPKNGKPGLAYNDSKVDHAGRYWVGTYDLSEKDANGVFYRVAVDGSSELADQGFVICNGPAFSPDNRTLYFSDTVGRRIISYDLDSGGTISCPRDFFSFSRDDGMPDGLTVDSAGNVWCALYGGGKVVCIGDDGRLKLSLALPASHVTSVCFGGPELKTLYVTSGWGPATAAKDQGGAVFMRSIDWPGLPEKSVRL